MTYRSLTVAVVSAALLWSAMDVVAQPRTGRRMARRPDIAKALELTTEQQEELKALRTKGAKTMTQLGADLKIAGMELRSLMGEASPNAADVKARVAEVNRIRAQILSARIDGQLARAAVFTPEQKEKMKGLRKGRGMAKGRAMMGRGRQMEGRGHAAMGRGGRMKGRGHATMRGGHRAPGRGRAMAPQARGAKGQRGAHRPNLAKALELTPAQQKKLKALNLSGSKAMIRLQADQKVATLDLKSGMAKATPGSADVKALVAKVNNVRARILSARVDQQLAKAAVFTPEQKEKMKELREKGKARGQRPMMQRGPGTMQGGRRMMMRRHMQAGKCPLGAECPGCPRCPRESCPKGAQATPKQ